MGLYVNPRTGTKEEWLIKHGIEMSREMALEWAENVINWGGPSSLVCLVANSLFSAAEIATHPARVSDWVRKADPRPKKFYCADIEDLFKETLRLPWPRGQYWAEGPWKEMYEMWLEEQDQKDSTDNEATA